MNRCNRSFGGAVFVLLFELVLVGDAGARSVAPEDEREARKHHQTAEARFRAGLFAEALAEYQAGYEALSMPGFLINIAQCYRRLGDLKRASATYRRFTVVAPNSPLAPKAKALIAELDQRLTDFRNAGLNGNDLGSSREEDQILPLSVFLNPPAAAGDDAPLILTALAPEPEPPPVARRRWWLWTAIGAAVVGGTVAAIVLASGQASATANEGSLGSLRR